MQPLSTSTKFNLSPKRFSNFSAKSNLLKNREQELKEKQEKASKRLLDSHGKKKFPHILSMYKKPPLDSLSLEMFEKLAICRYKILLAMDSLAAVCTKFSKDWEERLEKRLSDIQVEEIFLGKFLVQDVRNDSFIKEKEYYQKYISYDYWSHFILRLAYSRSEELKNWFLTHECDLLRYRLSKQTTLTGHLRLSNFMTNEGLTYEKAKHTTSQGTHDYYKVNWTAVLPLIKFRQVHLENGFAYVDESQINHIITDHFKQHLKKVLAIGQKHWASGGLQDEEQRLVPLLKYFSQQNSESYTANNTDGVITAKNLDEVASNNFPLCISSMHKHWRKHHHMKHFARLAYWRFLKQAGLSLDDCLTIFREEAQKYPNGQKQFEKEFAYNIRHAYGKEGKRADYTGFFCQKMINENIASGDCHGCPYKYDKENLEDLAIKLKTLGGLKDTEQIKQILELSKNGHYQLACSKQFEYKYANVKHDVVDIEDIASGIISPNQYFDKSVKLIKGEIGQTKKIKEENIANTNNIVIHTKWKSEQEIQSQKLKKENIANEIDDNEFEGLDFGEEDEHLLSSNLRNNKIPKSTSKPRSDEEDILVGDGKNSKCSLKKEVVSSPKRAITPLSDAGSTREEPSDEMVMKDASDEDEMVI